MDDEDTAGYRELCPQCAAVDWGISDEGRFYCRSCHNVIERTREVLDMSFLSDTSRISWVSSRSRTRKPERGYVWTLTEVFQFILKSQADALLRLGVSPRFKDDVLCHMWRLYLQKSKQAYTNDPVNSLKLRGEALGSELDSAADSVLSQNLSNTESNVPSSADFNSASDSDWLGSGHSSARPTASWKRSRGLMTMKKTLALIHLALVWSREALTLSDLLRLVKSGHVPYVTAYEQLPEEMKLVGQEALFFHVETIPSHRSVHKEAQALLLFLQLPAFPPISPQASLHPSQLCLRYLTDANLPDQLHRWVCVLMERAGMADQRRHTVDVASQPDLPPYDLQAAALLVVTMKALFGLDDQTEWDLSNKAGSQDDSEMFSFRKWYRLVQAALTRAQRRRNRDVARKQWRGQKVFYTNKRDKRFAIKKRRISESVQMCFKSLTSQPDADAVQDAAASSFQFCWGDESGSDGSDGPGLHHLKLDAVVVVSLSRGVAAPRNVTYWHPPLRPCDPWRCSSHFPELEPTLPRSFAWLLRLFAFLLDVEPGRLFDEVLQVERRLFAVKSPPSGRRGEEEEKAGKRRRGNGGRNRAGVRVEIQ